MSDPTEFLVSGGVKALYEALHPENDDEVVLEALQEINHHLTRWEPDRSSLLTGPVWGELVRRASVPAFTKPILHLLKYTTAPTHTDDVVGLLETLLEHIPDLAPDARSLWMRTLDVVTSDPGAAHHRQAVLDRGLLDVILNEDLEYTPFTCVYALRVLASMSSDGGEGAHPRRMDALSLLLGLLRKDYTPAIVDVDGHPRLDARGPLFHGLHAASTCLYNILEAHPEAVTTSECRGLLESIFRFAWISAGPALDGAACLLGGIIRRNTPDKIQEMVEDPRLFVHHVLLRSMAEPVSRRCVSFGVAAIRDYLRDPRADRSLVNAPAPSSYVKTLGYLYSIADCLRYVRGHHAEKGVRGVAGEVLSMLE